MLKESAPAAAQDGYLRRLLQLVIGNLGEFCQMPHQADFKRTIPMDRNRIRTTLSVLP